MTILVTGSAGMIGSHLVQGLLENNYRVIGIDKKPIEFDDDYQHCQIDLGDVDSLEKLFSENKIDRVIHLAALAHTMGGKKYPKKMYEYLNVECANNIFRVSANHGTPVLFISTVDVFGFQKGIVNSKTICKPVTIYGKTKFQAEQLLKASDANYDIFRFSPVYTPEQKRDIQKRIYLKYPKWAYQIGKNTQYEVLNIDNAVKSMVSWCAQKPNKSVRIIKDENLLNTIDYIAGEKKLGRAKYLIKIPKWIAWFVYGLARISGRNKRTFLLNKAINPLRTTNEI